MSDALAPRPDVTLLLKEWSDGRTGALEELIPLVYDELHRVAQAHLRRERADHSLQATALVNEAYMRLVGQNRVQWQNRAQFFGTAARMMRRILIDCARERLRAKRGGGATRVLLDSAAGATQPKDVELLALDAALEKLGMLDARQSQVVELRFFGGLSIEETASALEISPATVKREWSSARFWLKRELATAV